MINYNEFLRMLRREAGRPTLFEPHPTRKITTQLIWRGGDNLWDTPSHRVDTLIALFEYIKSDTAIIEADRDTIDEILSCAALLPEGMKFTVLSNDIEALTLADRDDAVCALASRTQICGSDFKKPLIFMAERDDEIEPAIARRVAGVYIPHDIERLWREYGDKIALLGGLGEECINTGEPVDIHKRIRALHELTNGAGYAIGSGLDGSADVNYLGFISMLGIYHNLMKDSRS